MGFQSLKVPGFGYRNNPGGAPTTKVGNYSIEMLHRLQCKVCPLNNQRGLKNPHMSPSGPVKARVYMLGEGPGADEDARGEPFVGRAGRTLRLRIPERWEGKYRMNNVVRTRPPDNRTPEPIEIECCRPSVVEDIERCAPEAIFGFGNVPLGWCIPGMSGITRWTMRRVPVQIGKHKCWLFPMLHPSYVMRSRRKDYKTGAPVDIRSPDQYGSEEEFLFAKNMQWAFEEVERGLPKPVVHTRDFALDGVEFVTGDKEGDLDRVAKWLDLCFSKKLVGLDYETNAARPYEKGAKVLSAAVACNEGVLAFPFDHPQAGWSEEEREELRELWTVFLTNSDCAKAAHQAAFEIEWSSVMFDKDAAWFGHWEDTKGQAYILDERQPEGNKKGGGSHSLGFLGIQYFGLDIKAISDVNAKKLESEDLERVLRYNALDAKYHRLLFLKQQDRLEDEGLVEVYDEHVRRVTTATLTQVKGVPVDQKAVTHFADKYGKEREEAEKQLFSLSVVKNYRDKKGRPFEPSKNLDVANILHKLGVHGFEDVTEETLAAANHPFGNAMVRWRKANKAKSTYIDPCQPDFEKTNLYPDGMLHPILSCDKTTTWRSSSETPNIQNWDKRSEKKELRGMVKAPPGHKIVSFDYAGIQARNVAMESKDKALVDAFWNDYDIHKDWMEQIIREVPKWCDTKKAANDKDYMKGLRHTAKNKFVFPSFFGATPHTVAYYLGIDDKPAERIQEKFWDRFHDIYKWHKKLERHYEEHGWITGHSGMIRRAPIARNQMINAPIQADESIIVFDAMARLSEMDFDKFQATLMVHDDLTFIWPDKKIEEYAETVVNVMVNTPYKWAHIVPIGVEMSVGQDWASVKEVGAWATHTWKGLVELKKDRAP